MKTLLSIILIAALATVAGAEVLWDQSDYDAFGMGFFNSESGAPPFGLTQHAVNDISVPGTWTITTISTYFSTLDMGWGDAISTGYLHIFPKTGVMPGELDDPTASLMVPMSGALVDDAIVVTATDLALTIEPGEYWIGITPVAPGGMWGPEANLASMTLIGDATASYDPYGMPEPGWMNFVPGADASILIEGEATVATESSSLTGIKELFR